MLFLFNGLPLHFQSVGRSGLAPHARVRARSSPRPGLLSCGLAHAACLLLHSRARCTLRPRAGGKRRVPPPSTLGFTALCPRLCLQSTPHSLSPSLPLEERSPALATARHHLRRRVSAPVSRLLSIARTPRSVTSPSPSNKPSRRLSCYSKARLSVPVRAPSSPAFAISSRNPCALHLVRSWPGMAVGR
jgi:hypothetical protein